MRGRTSLRAVVLAATISVVASTTSAAGFDDVVAGSYYEAAVEWMAHEGITTGTSPSTFTPDRAVSRAEFATFLWRFAGSPTGAPDAGFTDVVDGSFYESAVNWLAEAEITTGTSPNTFSPADPVSRAQAATFLWRYMCEPVPSTNSSFPDVEPGRYFTAPVAWLLQEGITTGTSPTTFDPFAAVTRAQAGTFLHRLAGKPAVGAAGANRSAPCGPVVASVNVSPVAIDFGSIELGTESAVAKVTLTNSSTVPVVASAAETAFVGTEPGDPYQVSPSSLTVPALGSAEFTVTFDPSVVGEFPGLLEVDTGGTAPVQIPLAGNAPLDIVHRVNAGGPQIGGSPPWLADTTAAPSPYVNAASTNTTADPQTSDLGDPSVPSGTPALLFNSERWDGAAPPEMAWDLPVPGGVYAVRVYLAETFAGNYATGARVFDINVEGLLVHDDIDVFDTVGADAALVLTSVHAVNDGNLDIDFVHQGADNPTVKAIEVVRIAEPSAPRGVVAVPSDFDFGAVNIVSGPSTGHVTVFNPGASAVNVTSIAVTGSTSFAPVDTSTVVPAGGQATIEVAFDPTNAGGATGTMTLTHGGVGSPTTVELSGTGTTASAAIGFSKSTLDLAGILSSIDNPTSLSWGPDGWLYVSELTGQIHALQITRNAANDYEVTAATSTNLVKNLTNHDDDGTVNGSVTGRLVTGVLAVGTSVDPEVFVTSSDPRIGAGDGGGSGDLDLDTNSGIISLLDRDGGSWTKQDVVRGLPRSEENHIANGMAIDTGTNTLYVVTGGNTNTGNVSTNFAELPEYALSTAILSVDLDAIGTGTWDLVTLDDPGQPGTSDNNDPFGGNDGDNMAIVDADGPVQIYAPGFRNAYDMVLTQSGQMYSIDNGGNAGWGGPPVNEGPGGNCTYAIDNGGGDDDDILHHVTGPGYYAGHPNPTRGNDANTFAGNSPIAEVGENGIECDYVPDNQRGIASFGESTNGMTEYTATNFGGAMVGNLLAASYANLIERVALNGAGTAVDVKETLVNNVGGLPLDVDAMGDSEAFPGTVWVADFGGDAIVILEPSDYDGSAGTCNVANDPTVDADSDNYDNADEIQNGTNPCSPADVPPDNDGDFTSDLNDLDDDNDGTDDIYDPFALDPLDGVGATGPIDHDWQTPAGGILGLGFSGHMTNGSDAWHALFDRTNGTFVGAGGVATISAVPDGTSRLAENDQEFGLQFGADRTAAAAPFTIETRIQTPFAVARPQAGQEMGIFFGTGTQDSYLQLVLDSEGVSRAVESAGVTSGAATAARAWLGGVDAVELEIVVDPVADTATTRYSLDGGSSWTPVGGPIAFPSTWLDNPIAVGIISTSDGAPVFGATWDYIAIS